MTAQPRWTTLVCRYQVAMPSEWTSKRGAALRWVGVVATTLGLFAACGGNAMGPTEGSGGASSASGGTATATGGTDSVGSGGANVGSGGANVSESGGTTAEGGGALLSEEEWRAATAPIPGPHDIWTVDTCQEPHTGSNSERLGPEYSVIPLIGYTATADFNAVTNRVYDVAVMDYCVTSAECSEEPGGACQGYTGDAYCLYPDPSPAETCSIDADCTTKPEGTCNLPLGPEENTVCYPTGVCEKLDGKCVYAGDVPCTSDADCSAGADGKCIFPVWTQCSYGTCLEETDCAGGYRCGCGRCLQDHCGLSDDDCGAGETCELDASGCHVSQAFYCTTPRDECEVGDPPICSYQDDEEGGYWSASTDCTIW